MSILAKTNNNSYTGFKSNYVNDILWLWKLSLIHTKCTFSLSVFLPLYSLYCTKSSRSALILLLVHRRYSTGCTNENNNSVQPEFTPSPSMDPRHTSTAGRVGRPLLFAPSTLGPPLPTPVTLHFT